MSGTADSKLARLKRLPPRLRVAHLMALSRYGREIDAGERFLSYPSPAERLGMVAGAQRRSGGGAIGSGRIQLLGLVPADPHPGSLSLADLESELARLGPRKWEGSDPSTDSRCSGRR